jgi:hypothetical protein
MNTTTRHTYTAPDDARFERIDGPAVVYVIHPDDEDPRRLNLCEVGSGEDFTRCTRAELREWAQTVLAVLDGGDR